jgi:two-component system, NarL family, invasion response regulator UvrY
MIQVLLIDDHALVRAGIRQLLLKAQGIEVIGEAGSGEEGVKLTRELHPNVVLLDFKLPDITGLEVIARLLRINPHIKIVMLSSAINDLFPLRSLDAGARGYLTKNATKEELVRAIHAVAAGQKVISPLIASRLALAKIDDKIPASYSSLGNKEFEVMMMTIRGVPIKEIADRLHINHKTIHSYRCRIFEKLQVNNDVDLTLLAIREGLITADEAES